MRPTGSTPVVIIVLVMASLLTYGGCLLAGTDIVPAFGEVRDRWLAVMVQVMVLSVASAFIVFVGISRALLLVSPVVSRSERSTERLLVVSGVILSVAVALVLTGSYLFGDAQNTAGVQWDAEIDGAYADLLTDLESQYREANNDPVIIRQYLNWTNENTGLSNAAVIVQQLEKHAKRLDRWREAAERVLEEKVSKYRESHLRAVDQQVRGEGAAKRKPVRPQKWVVQLAPVEAAEHSRGDEQPWHGAATEKILENGVLDLWFVSSTELSAIDGAAEKVRRARDTLVHTTVKLSEVQLETVSGDLVMVATRLDNLRFRKGVHPLRELAGNPTRVGKILAADEAETTKLIEALKEFRRDEQRETGSEWTAGMQDFTQSASRPVLDARADVAARLTSLFEAGDNYFKAIDTSDLDESQMALLQKRRDNFGLLLSDVLGIDRVGFAVPRAPSGAPDVAKIVRERLEPDGKLLQAVSIQANELYLTAQVWLAQSKQLRDFVGPLSDGVAPGWIGDVPLRSPFEEARNKAVDALRREVIAGPSDLDVVRAAMRVNDPRLRLGDEARRRAWIKMGMTAEDPILGFPVALSPSEPPKLLRAKIDGLWTGTLVAREKDLFVPGGLDAVANDLAAQGTQAIIELFEGILIGASRNWAYAYKQHGNPTDADAFVKNPTIDLSASDRENFWGQGLEKAQLPYWKREHWKEHKTEYDKLLAEMGTAEADQIKPHYNMLWPSPNVTAEQELTARKDALANNRAYWSVHIDGLIKALKSGSADQRNEPTKQSAVHYDLIHSGGSGAAIWGNPFRRLARGKASDQAKSEAGNHSNLTEGSKLPAKSDTVDFKKFHSDVGGDIASAAQLLYEQGYDPNMIPNLPRQLVAAWKRNKDEREQTARPR